MLMPHSTLARFIHDFASKTYHICTVNSFQNLINCRLCSFTTTSTIKKAFIASQHTILSSMTIQRAQALTQLLDSPHSPVLQLVQEPFERDSPSALCVSAERPYCIQGTLHPASHAQSYCSLLINFQCTTINQLYLVSHSLLS